jgi:dihydrofolate reductase
MIELSLIDELRIFRNPVVVGAGTPFLPPVTDDIRLDLVDTKSSARTSSTSATDAPTASRTDTSMSGRAV